MWLLLAREPRPEASDWYGRHTLAAVDAVVWPLLWVWVFRNAPEPVGLVEPVVTALAVLCALSRLHRALWLNHRYWFTTWRWSKLLGTVQLLGAVMKVLMSA